MTCTTSSRGPYQACAITGTTRRATPSSLRLNPWVGFAPKPGHVSALAQFPKAAVYVRRYAWITWPDWPITHSDVAEIVELSEQRRIWRDVNVVVAPDADPASRRFLEFLSSGPGAAIMKTEGWIR